VIEEMMMMITMMRGAHGLIASVLRGTIHRKFLSNFRVGAYRTLG
jgi:hypothetical protein